MNLKKKTAQIALSFSTMLASTTTALAQITNPAIGNLSDAEEAESGTLFVRIFIQLWNVIITIGGIIVIVMFLWGAIEWITAGGDSGKIQSAQKRLTHAALGLFILVMSFAIIEYISYIFFEGEFNILNLTLPTVGSGD